MLTGTPLSTNSGWTVESGLVAPPPPSRDAMGRKRAWGSGSRQRPDSVHTISPSQRSVRTFNGTRAAVWVAAIDAATA